MIIKAESVLVPPRKDAYCEYHDQVDRQVAECAPFPEGSFQGKGVVICGGGRYWPSVWVSVKRLRAAGCRLPIELWHLGPDELGSREISLLAPLGVQCVDGLAVRQRYPARILNGWELKAYAVIHSRFSEVLFLDADNVAVRDPTYLFGSPEYLHHGSLFWPDRGCLAGDRPIWAICRVRYREEPEFESGQMIIDKRRAWQALNLAMHFNEYSDFYYHYMHGDKETFHMAWRYLGQAYHMIDRPMHEVDGVFHQHDHEGKVIFQHGVKWSLTEPHRARAEYAHEEECLVYLHELESLSAPSTTMIAQCAENS